MSRELRNRLTFGVIFAALVIGTLTFDFRHGGSQGMAVLVTVIISLGAREYVRLARSLAPGLGLAPVLVPALALALAPLAEQVGLPPAPWAVLVAGLGLGWVLIDQLFRRAIDGFFPHIGAALLGILYLGLPLHVLMVLADLPGQDGARRGIALLLVFVATVKLGDVTAFFTGKAFGRNKMCPSISPGKTWEGFAGSFLGSVGGAYLFTWLVGVGLGVAPFAGWWQPAVWGLILGPLGVLGDLAESAMKRAAAVKDSGGSMPGFGGVLDIYDALVIAAPVALLLARVL
jgi:phosphatidate cytidylyltransferase